MTEIFNRVEFVSVATAYGWGETIELPMSGGKVTEGVVQGWEGVGRIIGAAWGEARDWIKSPLIRGRPLWAPSMLIPHEWNVL